MNYENAFQTALDADLADHLTRLVFADWLQERNDPRADGYRLMGLLELHPVGTLWEPDKDGEVVWILGRSDNRVHFSGSKYSPCLLPDECFLTIPKSHQEDLNWWRYFTNRKAADDAASRALATLSSHRRAELLSREGVPA